MAAFILSLRHQQQHHVYLGKKMEVGIWQSVRAFLCRTSATQCRTPQIRMGMSTTRTLAMAATVDSSSLAWRNASWPGSGQTSAFLTLGLEYQNRPAPDLHSM